MTIPLYQPGAPAASLLRYSVTLWPSKKIGGLEGALRATAPSWETDGMRLLEHARTPSQIQLAFSAKPHLSPVFIAARTKGRLQYSLRKLSPEFAGFSRKVSVRSLGENTTGDIEKYIANQTGAAGFADSRFRDFIGQFTAAPAGISLAEPSLSAHGCYWYNLHIVLVAALREPIVERRLLTAIQEGCFSAAREEGHEIAALSLMPDHLHLALRGGIKRSPEEIAVFFQNRLAERIGGRRIWRDTYYAGTFSEYDFGAIRARARGEPSI